MNFNDLKKYTVLVVDDDKNILNVYKDLLEVFFKKVYIAGDGKEGLTNFKKYNPDIIITDYKMPKINGLEMAEDILKIDEKIPIILLTAFDDKYILKDAINKNIVSFIQKPIKKEELFEAFNKVLEKLNKNKRFKEQEKIIEYKNYQEYLAYEKEKLILKKENNQIEVFYKPLDITSGDSYSIRKKLFFLSDAMGKGISASITSMIATSFFNYLVDKNYNFENLLKEFIFFIKNKLLEYEIFCFGIYMIENNMLYYSTFSLPPFLYQKENRIYKIKSNNLPLSNYNKHFNISKIDLNSIEKVLFYTDGLSENLTKDGKLYNNYLEKDFLISSNIDEFEKLRNKKIKFQEDDITYLYYKSE